MFDFTHNFELHNIIASVYERGAIVASVGHGGRGLLHNQAPRLRRGTQGEYR